jgi:hypothetical protein
MPAGTPYLVKLGSPLLGPQNSLVGPSAGTPATTASNSARHTVGVW